MHRIVQFVESLDENLEYFDHKIVSDEIVIYAKFKKGHVRCPHCGSIATGGRSEQYKRSCQDLPLLGKKTRIVLGIRYLYCCNPKCSHNIFAEPCNFLLRRGKQTKRLLAKMDCTTRQEKT